jgi:hypothetical protein
LPAFADNVATVTNNGRRYLLYAKSVSNALGKPVGEIITGKDLSIEQEALDKYDRLNYWVVGAALLVGVSLVVGLVSRELLRGSSAVPIEEALKVGETLTVEFKSAFQWDFGRNEKNDDRRLDTLKSIVGFLNAKGGTLFVGVTENTVPASVRGLEEDLGTVRGSTDRLRLLLRDLITTRIGPEFSPFIVDTIEEYDGRLYWKIVVDRSPVAAFVLWDNKRRFYVREGPKTSELDPEGTWRYIKSRWG